MRQSTSILLALFLQGLFFIASAVPVDTFGDTQVVIGDPSVTTFDSVVTPNAFGGTRGIFVQITQGRNVIVSVIAGHLNHSQGAGAAGLSLISWDGDSLEALNPTGLGGMDFTSDLADRFILEQLSYDFSSGLPARITIRVYSSAVSASESAIELDSILTNVNLEFPFSNFLPIAGFSPADFTNVGAIELEVFGIDAPAADVEFGFFRTNGVCEEFPSGPIFMDECGVCGGDNQSCADCAGEPNGNAVIDECGICEGDNSSCSDCAGVPNGNAVIDECGVCEGDNSTCLDCAGVPNGLAVVDECGVCDGDGSSCADCAGVPNGQSFIDECGVCGGDNSSCADCAGVPNGGAVVDLCGVCDGDNSACTDCAGVPNGSAFFDVCGVCGGDGTTCLDCVGTHNGTALPGTSCSTGLGGACGDGLYDQSCVCLPSVQEEVCDNIDNDCDGLVDEDGVCDPVETLDVCVLSTQESPYRVLAKEGRKEHRFVKRVVNTQLKRRKNKKRSVRRFIRTSRMLRQTIVSIVNELPKELVISSASCVCSMSDQGDDLSQIEKVSRRWIRLMNKIVRQLEGEQGDGVCKGSTKACLERFFEKKRLLNSYKRRIRRLHTNNVRILRTLPEATVGSCQ